MPLVKKRTISLPPTQASYIDGLVETGTYASVSEVVRADPRALQECDAAVARGLREEVVPVYRAMPADPRRGIPADRQQPFVMPRRIKTGDDGRRLIPGARDGGQDRFSPRRECAMAGPKPLMRHTPSVALNFFLHGEKAVLLWSGTVAYRAEFAGAAKPWVGQAVHAARSYLRWHVTMENVSDQRETALGHAARAAGRQTNSMHLYPTY